MPDDKGHQDALEIIEPVDIQEEMERSFLEYSMSVIVSRALPDVRDGLKPVHRRILYGMYVGGLRPERPHRKCARVVGDVMGSYHPHGDQAIYDALARMAQSFSLRYPLIDGHGNFGSPDPNDRPAAMRYCVVGGTRVKTPFGSPRIETLAGDPVASDSTTDIEAKVFDHRGHLVLASKLFHSGSHPTLRLRTREGFELTGTHNHPVLCLEVVDGVPVLDWRLLSELHPGSVVVLDRRTELAAPEDLTAHEQHLALLLGAFVSEGYASATRAGFNNTDEGFFTQVLEAYDALVGGPRDVGSRTIASGSVLHELDIHGSAEFRFSELGEALGTRTSAYKEIPETVWTSSLAFKQRFLQALFEADGSSSLLGRDTIQISYSTQSERLARDVQRLLLEFGVVSRRSRSARGEWKVYVENRRDARLFATNVGFLGRKHERLVEQLATLPVSSRSMSKDHVPHIAAYIRRRSGARGDDRVWLEKHNLDRIERWERDAEEILRRIPRTEVQRTVLELMDPGWYFAEVETIEDAGVEPVYSIRVDTDDHAFITDGFVSHNTECRLERLAMLMLEGIDEDTVDFEDTYDGENSEPRVLPARFPNLLVNGGGGIAVGMATNIPPHNLTEVIDATAHLIDHPDATVQDLMGFVQAPDFPTGGRILGRAGINDLYTTGRGSVKMRAVAEIEEGARGAMRIVVTETPYQTSVEQIGTKIEELVAERKLEGIRDVRNESSGVTQRLVIELKRDANPQVVLNQLWKHTPMQTNFAGLMLALVDGAPKILNLREILVAYVAHQVEVITRRSEFRLQKAKDRLHIVEGLLKALDNIDEIIQLIRESEDVDAARTALMGKKFGFTEIQANHILDMPLRRLTGLERQKLVDEGEELRATIKDLEDILGNEDRLRQVIKDELAEVREKFGDERRTPIEPDPGEIDMLDLIKDEEVVVVLSANGYVKAVKSDSFRSQGRGGRGVAGAKLRDDDYVAHLLTTSSHAYLLFFSNTGKVYRLRAHEIPMKDRTARGTALVNLIQIEQDEKIQAVIDTREYEEGVNLFFATRQGMVKKTKMSEYDSAYARSGIIAIKLNEGDELVKVVQTHGDDEVFMVSRKGMTIRFAEEEVRPMGRSAAGVRGMKLKSDDDAVVSCDVARDDADILIVTSSGHGKRTKLDRFNSQHRGGQGVRGMKITERRGAVVSAFMVGLEDEIIVFSGQGNVIRMQAKEISSQGRDATGVRVARIAGDDIVVAVAPVLDRDEETPSGPPGAVTLEDAGDDAEETSASDAPAKKRGGSGGKKSSGGRGRKKS